MLRVRLDRDHGFQGAMQHPSKKKALITEDGTPTRQRCNCWSGGWCGLAPERHGDVRFAHARLSEQQHISAIVNRGTVSALVLLTRDGCFYQRRASAESANKLMAPGRDFGRHLMSRC